MILPPENPYGHTKKLRYFLKHLSGISSGKMKLRGEPQIPANVLDFGCGNGVAVTAYLAKLFLHIDGVESDSACRDYMRATLPAVTVFPVSWVLPQENYDAIVCSDVLEHLPNPFITLRTLGRLLKPNGFIIGSIPNGHGLFELENRLYRSWAGLRLSQAVEILLNPWRLLRPNRTSVPYNNASPHVQFFLLEDFFDLVDAAGFWIADFSNGTVLGSPPITAHILEKSQWLMNLNGYIADHMKSRHVSTWLFKLVKK